MQHLKHASKNRLATLGCVAFGLALVAPAASAARIVGNGGVGVFCPSPVGSQNVLKIMDFYEAEREWVMTTPSLGTPDIDPFVKVGLALDRLAVFDPERAALYRDWLADFPIDMNLMDQEFDVISDYGSPLLGQGCSVVQIAVQHVPQNPEDRRYLINQALWSNPTFDNDQKAGLILHEIIYRDALSRGQPDSTSTHYFTALVASTEMELTMTADVFKARLRLYNMDAYVADIGGVCTDINHATYLYFDQAIAASADAKSFCEGLSDNAGLAGLDVFNSSYPGACQETLTNSWKDSAIGAKLLDDAAGSNLWLDAGLLSFTRNGIQGPVGANPTTGGALCWDDQHR